MSTSISSSGGIRGFPAPNAARRRSPGSSRRSRWSAPPDRPAHSRVAAAVAAEAVAAVTELTRVDELRAFGEVVAGCRNCALAGGRTQVVFGAGDPNSDLMFVGEAPGFHEDK